MESLEHYKLQLDKLRNKKKLSESDIVQELKLKNIIVLIKLLNDLNQISETGYFTRGTQMVNYFEIKAAIESLEKLDNTYRKMFNVKTDETEDLQVSFDGALKITNKILKETKKQ